MMETVAAVLERAFTALHLPPLFTTLPGVLMRLPSLSPTAFLETTTDPRHFPLALTLLVIPTCYVLGLLSGNVGWVDRIYTTWPPLCAATILAWMFVNDHGVMYGACLPRMALVFLLQIIWSARLTWHTARRGLYHPFSEDYRYQVLRKFIPNFAFELLHVFLVVIPQPMLLYSLCLPFAALIRPPAALSAGPFPDYYVPYSAVAALIPSRFAVPSGNTPVLNASDAFFAAFSFLAIAMEAAGDNAMYAYQTAKHALMERFPAKEKKKSTSRAPEPVAVPPAYYPGFPILGLHAWSRHPNFASEQSFWLSQGLFALGCCAPASAEVALGPAFALSILFCGSTRLTEWITTRKYPVYSAYSQLVGQFLPQETVLNWMWTAITGKWPRLEAEVYKRGSELYRNAVESGSEMSVASDDLTHSNLRVKDRVVSSVKNK